MKIISKKDALHHEKPEGVIVDYYLRKEYELHFNQQPPHTTQTWHHHNNIFETLFIVDGELVAKWREANKEFSKTVHTGDLIETENTPHTFENQTDHVVTFIVIKRVPSGRDHSKILKTDKVLDNPDIKN